MQFQETIRESDGEITSIMAIQASGKHERVKEGSFYWPHYQEAKTDGVLHQMLAPVIIPAPTPPTLAELKAQKIAQIEANSDTLLDSNAFAFSGKQFGQHPQKDGIRWHELLSCAVAGLIQYPVKVYGTDRQPIVLTDLDGVKAFIGTYMVSRETLLERGRELKQSIADAADETELDAIVDDRL